jgi:hypothetical protein
VAGRSKRNQETKRKELTSPLQRFRSINNWSDLHADFTYQRVGMDRDELY